MDDKSYRGYCGNNTAFREPGGCNNPRTFWDSSIDQFICPNCKWVSKFPEDFIKRYKEKHGL